MIFFCLKTNQAQSIYLQYGLISLIIHNQFDKCQFQLSNLLEKFIEELKRTIGVNQLLGTSINSSVISGSTNNNENFDCVNEELKRSSLKKLTSKTKIDHVYDLSTNIVEKATSRIKVINLNEEQLPLDKSFLDFIMNVRKIYI